MKYKQIMKVFVKVTALFELITGLGLIFCPKSIIFLLLGTTLDESGGLISAMVAGAALVSIAYVCWLSRDSVAVNLIIKSLLLYNTLVVGILLFGFINFKLNGIGLWLAIVLHSALSVWSLLLLLKEEALKKL
jgi:hypothetical protein